MPHGMDSIAVDIVGFCNARCKYCPAGAVGISNKYITAEKFEKIICKLLEYGLYNGSHTNFHIYGLGEPCLHPDINSILRILVKHGVHTAISTNASKVPQFEKDALECVDRFLISMPGFSQESYDKIHQFNFEKIKKNVVSLRHQISELTNNKIPFDMSYHIYQFNEAEMVPAKAFCEENEIRFAPNYAVLMDKDKCLSYVTGKMSYDELKDISKDIFLGVLDRQIQDAPRNYCDVQEAFLSINIDGDIRICSGFSPEKESEIVVGNILSDNIDDILYRKQHFKKCEECIKAGLTMAHGYECKVFPNGYYEIMKENEYINISIKEGRFDRLSERVNLLKMIRMYELKEYKEGLEQLLTYSRENGIESDIPDICARFVRFPELTYNHISKL